MCWLLPKGPNKLNAQSSFFPAMRQQLSADRETLEDCLATIQVVVWVSAEVGWPVREICVSDDVLSSFTYFTLLK